MNMMNTETGGDYKVQKFGSSGLFSQSLLYNAASPVQSATDLQNEADEFSEQQIYPPVQTVKTYYFNASSMKTAVKPKQASTNKHILNSNHLSSTAMTK